MITNVNCEVSQLVAQFSRHRANLPQIKDTLEKNLNSAEFEKGKFIIELDDVYTQKKIKSLLKESGYLTDSSFNSDLMKVPYEGLIELAEKIYSKKSSQKNFQDIVATKRLAATNRDILRSFKVPGTEIATGNLWDMLQSASKSLKSYIEEQLANRREKNSA